MSPVHQQTYTDLGGELPDALRSAAQSRDINLCLVAAVFFSGRQMPTQYKYLEIGGRDDTHASNTLGMTTALGWQGMLIKGNPEQYELMVKTQMESICVGVEICNPASMMQAITALPQLHPCPTTNSDRVGSIHYLVNPKIPRVSGLAELMSAK